MKISKYEKGVAGLDLFLSLIVSLFIIGLIIMIFSLMSGGLKEANYTSTTATVNGETVNAAQFNATGGYTLQGTGTNSDNYAIVAVYNNTSYILLSGNYTLTGNVLTNATALVGLTDMRVNYTYRYDADNTATYTIGNTSKALGSAVDWFDIFIVIGAMVVLILLVVIIIAAIRGSGLIAQGTA